MSATKRNTFIWDVPSKSHTAKKPDIPELYVHVDSVPETFENTPQIHATSSIITSNATVHNPIQSSNFDSLNIEKAVYKTISTEIPEHINELKKDIPNKDSTNRTMPTCINATESKLPTKTQADLDNISAGTGVDQQYDNIVTDPVNEITNNSKVCPDTKKFCKEDESFGDNYENFIIETDSECTDVSKHKTGKLINDKSVITSEADTLSSKCDLIQKTTADTSHAECPRTASNFIFKFSAPPLILPNTTKFKFIIGTKKEDIYRENNATKSNT